jgi:hypothetical protein
MASRKSSNTKIVPEVPTGSKLGKSIIYLKNHPGLMALSIITTVAAFVGGIVRGAAEFVDWRIANYETTVSPYDFGDLTSNMQGDGETEHWRKFTDHRGKTCYLGIKRWVQFNRSFSHPPSVKTALSLIGITPNQALRDHFKDNSEVALSLERLLPFCWVDTSKDAIKNNGFVVTLGVHIPDPGSEALISYIQNYDLPTANADWYDLALPGTKVHEYATNTDDRWFINFYYLVGTLDATWFAGN